MVAPGRPGPPVGDAGSRWLMPELTVALAKRLFLADSPARESFRDDFPDLSPGHGS